MYILNRIPFGLSRIYDEPFSTAIVVLIGLFTYSIIFRQTDVGRTTTDVFQAVREDITAAFKELWSCFKDACITLARTVTVVKLLEILIIGILLSSLPDALQFLFKTLYKIAKV